MNINRKRHAGSRTHWPAWPLEIAIGAMPSCYYGDLACDRLRTSDVATGTWPLFTAVSPVNVRGCHVCCLRHCVSLRCFRKQPVGNYLADGVWRIIRSRLVAGTNSAQAVDRAYSAHDTRTRCHFNMRSKADTSQLNLPHGNRQLKVENRKKTKK